MDWHTTGRSVKTDRMTNLDMGDVDSSSDIERASLVARVYQVGDTSSLSVSGIYVTGTLDVTRTTDEDGNLAYEFKDKSGRVLLTGR